MPAPFRYYLPSTSPALPDDIPVPLVVLRRFLDRLPADRPVDECWRLDGRNDPLGAYIHVAFNTSTGSKVALKAHRLSYLYFVGPIPYDLGVLHRCACKGCVNPAHLYAGTSTDNSADRWRWEAEEAAAGRITATARRHEIQRIEAARRRAVRCGAVVGQT